LFATIRPIFHSRDQCYDVLFPLKRSRNCIVRLKIDQRLDAVPLGKAICQAFSMFVNAPDKVVRYADI
jgi:hypothetical protein